MPTSVSAPVPTAPPKRWPWLLLAAVVGVVAIVVLVALHAREQGAKRAETQALLFAAELRDSVREITLFGNAIPRSQLAPALRPVVRSTARTMGERLERLDQTLDHADPRVEELRGELLRIRRMAATATDARVYDGALPPAAERMARTADAIAATERGRARLAARESIAGGALAVLLGMGIVALVLQRSQRLLLAAGRRQARQLQELADHDPLTGLNNRRRLGEDLVRLGRYATDAEPVQVMICDLDGFKALNDSLGHEAGDELLVRFAAQLVDAAGESGEVYRLGGDEFCVLSRPGRDIAGRVRLTLAGEGHSPVRGSAGLALWPCEAPNAREAMRMADERMYAAKAARRGRSRAA